MHPEIVMNFNVHAKPYNCKIFAIWFLLAKKLMICKYLKTINWQVPIKYHKPEIIEINNSLVFRRMTAKLYLLIFANLEGV